MRKLAGGVVREERRVSELAEAFAEDVSSLQKYTWCSHCAKQDGGFSKIYKKNYHMTQQFHSWIYT